MRMRFDPSFNAGNVLTAISMVVAVCGSYGMLDRRLAVQEANQAAQVATDRRQDDTISDMKRTTREDLKEINSKLDRLLMAAQSQQFPPPGRR